jgi:periplasmic nitrate reductase NapE
MALRGNCAVDRRALEAALTSINATASAAPTLALMPLTRRAPGTTRMPGMGPEPTGRSENDTPEPPEVPSRTQERTVLLLSLVVIAPVLAVGIVGGYGFIVWIYQMFAGPPGS